MATALQTIIVSKETASTRNAAKRVAAEFGPISTSRETTTSFRFRQRPPEDFREDSFRTKKIEGGVSLVYGTLKAGKKKKRNPDTYTDETRFMYGMERKIRGAENGYDLARLAREVDAMDLASMNVRRFILNVLMARAKDLKLPAGRLKKKDEEYRDIYFEMLLKHPTHPQGELFGNPKRRRRKNTTSMPKVGDRHGDWEVVEVTKDPKLKKLVKLRNSVGYTIGIHINSDRWWETKKIEVWQTLDANPLEALNNWVPVKSDSKEVTASHWDHAVRAAVDWAEVELDRARRWQVRKAAEKAKRKTNPGKPIRLKNPRTMPDPGPMSWLGTTLEWKWKGGKWENGKEDWLFLWSPKYKAVVAVKCPKKMDKLGKVSRRGGAAKTFERFMSRDPKATYDAEIPACKLVKLGKAVHIVYRSDKWKHGKKTEDYIHEFGKDVEIYCGPSKKNPDVFICFGGKLTATERGLVF